MKVQLVSWHSLLCSLKHIYTHAHRSMNIIALVDASCDPLLTLIILHSFSLYSVILILMLLLWVNVYVASNSHYDLLLFSFLSLHPAADIILVSRNSLLNVSQHPSPTQPQQSICNHLSFLFLSLFAAQGSNALVMNGSQETLVSTTTSTSLLFFLLFSSSPYRMRRTLQWKETFFFFFSCDILSGGERKIPYRDTFSLTLHCRLKYPGVSLTRENCKTLSEATHRWEKVQINEHLQ